MHTAHSAVALARNLSADMFDWSINVQSILYKMGNTMWGEKFIIYNIPETKLKDY